MRGGGGGGKTAQEVCVHRWRLGDCLGPWVLPRTAEMIEMNSAGTLVWLGIADIGSTLQSIT